MEPDNPVAEENAKALFLFPQTPPLRFDDRQGDGNTLGGAVLFASEFDPAKSIRFSLRDFVRLHDGLEVLDVMRQQHLAMLATSGRDYRVG